MLQHVQEDETDVQQTMGVHLFLLVFYLLATMASTKSSLTSKVEQQEFASGASQHGITK